MNKTIRTYETQNNTYHIIKIAKTSYEQQQERKAELLYMIFQKAIGLILTVTSITMLVYGIIPAVLPLIMGIAVTLTKDHVICI
ncbi:MAG: hypothetical protein WCS56_04715 [Bacilli bacterium]